MENNTNIVMVDICEYTKLIEAEAKINIIKKNYKIVPSYTLVDFIATMVGDVKDGSTDNG